MHQLRLIGGQVVRHGFDALIWALIAFAELLGDSVVDKALA